jgi:hypothetical protein
MGTCTDTARKEQPHDSRKCLTVAQADPVRMIGGKQHTNRLLDLGVRIKDDLILFCVDESNRKGKLECSSLRFIEDTSDASEHAECAIRLHSSYLSSPAITDH